MDKLKDFSLPVLNFNSKHYFILFLIWPFLSFLIAINNYRQREAKIVVFLFLLYYGFSFHLTTTGYVDAIGYAKELEKNRDIPFAHFLETVKGLYKVSRSNDIYEPFISFILSRITGNFRILFGIFAAFFGYFYLKSINLLFEKYLRNQNLNALIHLIFFIGIVPITEINGVRMWTAAWIFFYGAINTILYHEKKYLFIAVSSSLVHFSFISVNILLVIYFLIGNRNLLYYPIVLASFIIPQIINPYFKNLAFQLGGNFQGKYENYSSAGYVLERQQVIAHSDWFIQIGNDLVYYYLILGIFVSKFYKISQESSLKSDLRQQGNLFSFLMLFMSFVNFARPIPSLGNRFQIVFFIFATFYLVLYFVNTGKIKLASLTLIGTIPMIIYLAVAFRIGSKNINAWIFSPCFGIPWLAPSISVADILFF